MCLFGFSDHSGKFRESGFGSVFDGAEAGGNLLNLSTQAVLALMRNVDVGSLDPTSSFVELGEDNIEQYHVPQGPNIGQERSTDIGKFVC